MKAASARAIQCLRANGFEEEADDYQDLRDRLALTIRALRSRDEELAEVFANRRLERSNMRSSSIEGPAGTGSASQSGSA